jgi:hypothetical protein
MIEFNTVQFTIYTVDVLVKGRIRKFQQRKKLYLSKVKFPVRTKRVINNIFDVFGVCIPFRRVFLAPVYVYGFFWHQLDTCLDFRDK